MAALAGGCTAVVVGQTEFLGRALSGGASVSSSNGGGAVMMPGLLQVVSVLGTKKKLAAGPVKKAVQKAVAKVNRPTNEELAKWYGMSVLHVERTLSFELYRRISFMISLSLSLYQAPEHLQWKKKHDCC
jgi:hypothetical protein